MNFTGVVTVDIGNEPTSLGLSLDVQGLGVGLDLEHLILGLGFVLVFVVLTTKLVLARLNLRTI